MHTTSRTAAPRARRPLRSAAVALTLAAAGVAACTETNDVATSPSAGLQVRPGVHRQYGAPIRLGDGRARGYVVVDRKNGGRALEIGVALDERALEGLPKPGTGHHGAHGEMHEYIVPLPEGHGTPFRFVELDWNPGGHEPPGVYDTPHFDFHFYTITKAERDAIDPALMSDEEYVQRSMNYPTAAAPPFYAPLAPPGPNRAVPRMGVHWTDLRSPELQGLLGNPDAYRPFTRTFIYGSWDGRFIFIEPMITRAHLLAARASTEPAVRDEVVPFPTSASYPTGAFRPDAYRITWDARAREYRVALTTVAEAAR